MAVLVWKHGKTPDEVRRLVQARMQSAGISSKGVWNENKFTASVGWGVILNFAGEIKSDVIILQKCSGAMGGVVLKKTREAFQDMLPDGEELDPIGDSQIKP